MGSLPPRTRKMTTTWKEFIHVHMDMLVATDFFTTEIWTRCGLVTYYILFFIHLESRKSPYRRGDIASRCSLDGTDGA